MEPGEILDFDKSFPEILSRAYSEKVRARRALALHSSMPASWRTARRDPARRLASSDLSPCSETILRFPQNMPCTLIAACLSAFASRLRGEAKLAKAGVGLNVTMSYIELYDEKQQTCSWIILVKSWCANLAT